MKFSAISLILIFTIFACQTNEKSQKETSSEVTKNNTIEYVSLVGNLRLRETPNLKSEVLYSFKEGEEMLFNGTKSDHQDKIKIRGKKINENWYEVQVKSNNEISGWVFGGAIGEKGTKSEMPRQRKKKKLNEISAEELVKVIEIEGVKRDFETYSGFYEYYLTSNDVKIKNGNFEFSSDYGEDGGASYSGEFINGTKGNIFKEDYSYAGEYEGSHTSQLYFNEEGKCTKIHFKGESRAGNYNKIFQDPECSFFDYHQQFIQENETRVTTTNVNVKPQSFNSESLVGNWTIIMKAKSSDCPTTSVGDIRTENWLMSIKSQQLIARKAAGDKSTASEYGGYIYGDNELKMKNTRKSNKDAQVKIDFKIINSRYMKGTRIVSNVNPCTIIYDITAEKK